MVRRRGDGCGPGPVVRLGSGGGGRGGERAAGEDCGAQQGAGAAAGFGLPRWVVGFLGKKRMKKFSLAFPDGVDILVRDDAEGFARTLLECAQDRARLAALSAAGQDLMAREYSQQASLDAKRAAYRHAGVM